MSASFGIQASVGGKFEPDDADKDGIEDDNDACPLLAEDIDSFEDGDGCPDDDNDKDGIPDKNDACPDVAGVASNQGCEETDNDHDGIKNKKDACPDAAEDKDGFEDSDGCPDKDNDQDGIVDTVDKCPMIPETVNELDDKDGCPDFIRVTENKIELLDRVYFSKNNKDIQDRSKPMLEEAASILALRPETKLRIEGYTDNTGAPKAATQRSAAQAEAVKAFFVNAGVDASRLTATGKGPENPVADNKTKDGRAKNNRIELIIEKSAPAADAAVPATGDTPAKTASSSPEKTEKK